MGWSRIKPPLEIAAMIKEGELLINLSKILGCLGNVFVLVKISVTDINL